MDVTDQVQQIHLTYGSSDNTNTGSLAASKKLNYAEGSSISKPENLSTAVMPFTYNFEDSLGLFGSENHYVKVNVNVDFRLSNLSKGITENDYLGGTISTLDEAEQTLSVGGRPAPITPYGDEASLDYDLDPNTVNSYEPAFLKYGIAPLPDGFLSIDLNNIGTGNTFIDSYLDVRLYSRAREEHPYDLMYIRPKDFFYIGFHARDSRRLPYKVTCSIGNKILDRQEIEQRYIAMASRDLVCPTFSEVPPII